MVHYTKIKRIVEKKPKKSKKKLVWIQVEKEEED